MKFSNKIRYGLQFLLFISVDTETYTDIQRAAISCDISHKFLEAIAVDLKKKGLLIVKRGAGGGYKLAKKIDKITMADVMRALGKKDPMKNTPKNEITQQVVDKILTHTQKQFWDLMEKVSLLDMQKIYYEDSDKIMYYI
ncbi:MAG TPA: Rrf2 family transcriptional regulator [Marinilabiliaceae bacterium]|nr:Rrf2 family transcriptional regulator [Marinilabiliaceae bacterium]